MNDMTNARLAVIGLGRMGIRHVLAARELGIPIAGLYDQDNRVAEQVANDLNVNGSAVFKSADALMETSGANILAVATTANAHFDYVMAGSRAGFSHILCEKPMAVSVAQCEEMIERCKESQTLLGVNHYSRFTKRFELLERMLSSSSMGQITSMTSVAGNIGLAMGVSHYIELFRILAHERVSEVRFLSDPMTESNPRGQQFIDPAGRLLATTGSGQRMYIEFGPDQGHGVTSIYSAKYGQIFLNDLTGAGAYTQRLPVDQDLPLTRYGCDADEGPLLIEIEDVVSVTGLVWKALLEGKGFPTGEDGLYVVSTLAAAELSAKLGGIAVHLGADLDRQAAFNWA